MSYQKALERYMKATNTHDFENVQACLDTSAVYWFSDRTCKTLEEIRAYFEHAWEVIQDEVYSASDVQWIAVDEQTAVCLYTYHWSGLYQGKQAEGSGRATNVFKLIAGEWKLVHEHLSALK
ncbi:nuclear transport factor 2 family protein [Paenibacillus alvei]|uniref:YybH family protein n=1 Tax=Paenibacillus alvei TaxID=44250 RepID=UPI000287B626|nr:nuclear transport factor 2 family protein [Paenibacillus alvei]EJW20117.1 hypothetical protein PAV_1c11160 [Paenibacillus alvei DSM 29]MBG9737635.1 cag pathogenicity island protein Cag4 [Paenibacillus alvei]MBG9747328.1 cag pathogenicity island protein Cag4 [Paenibacillus alvei]MCY9539495.1 nuclear transport factor 2 family protein [Paenibacillus alvei]MCY9581181.1 nuclear transport factor 2 family protein [Paenibacillus alvei]